MPNFNEMTPKTRAMIALSVVLILLGIPLLAADGAGVFLLLPVAIYWGYRFTVDGTNIK